MAAGSGAIRAGAAFVEVFAKDMVAKGLRSALAKFKAFGAGIQSVASKLLLFDAARLAGFGLAAKAFADMGSAMLDASQRTGIGVEALSELGFAAEQSGSSMEDLETGIKMMQKTISKAGEGGKEANDALADLRTTFAQLQGLSPEDQFTLLAQRISEIPDPARRTAAALEVFGRGGAQLLPLMNQGAAGIEALRRKAQELGLTMSTADAESAEAFGDQLSALWKQVKMVTFQIGAALVPVLRNVVDWIMVVGKQVIDWITANKELLQVIFMGLAAFVAIEAALWAFGAAVSGVGAILGGLGSVIGTLGSIIGFLMSPIGLIIGGLTALAAKFIVSTDTGAQAVTAFGEVFTDIMDTAHTAWGGIVDAIAAGDLALAAQIAWLGIKAAFQSGWSFIQGIWINVKTSTLKLFTEIAGAILMILNDVWAGMQIGWEESTAFLSQSWSSFIGVLKKGWNHFAGFFKKVWATIKAKFSGGNAQEEIDKVNEEVAAKDQEITAETQKKIQDREAQRQKRREEIRKEAEEQEKAIAGGVVGEQDELEKKRKQDLADSAAAVQKAKDDLNAARQTAKEKRAIADKEKKAAVKVKAPELPEAIEAAEKAKVSVKGTFSAALAGMMGGSSEETRTARATEQTAENTRRLLAELRAGGGLV